MIAHIKGVLTETDLHSVIIDVNGLGYQVHIPLSTYDRLPRVGAEIALRTHMIMREDDVSLYGFHTEEERKLFRLLLNVSGVGAKIALAALSSLPPATFCQAVLDNNVKVVSSISGIGKKTAERLILELKDKVENLYISEEAPSTAGPVKELDAPALQDAALALETLGFPQAKIRKIVKEIYSELAPEQRNSENIIRQALQKLNS